MQNSLKKEENNLSQSTVNQQEVDNFNAYNENWWDPEGPLKPLHALNPVRLEFIKTRTLKALKGEMFDVNQPLAGLEFVDIGCGAGLVSEPMARLGAKVTGVDASEKAITQARSHAIEMNLDIDYKLSSVEKLVEAGETYDVVMALEIIEHVDNPQEFVNLAAKLLKPKGVMFFSTLNRTWFSYMKAILAAEYILKWVPQGTHQWQKFVKPSELGGWLRTNNLYLSDIKGIDYSFLKRNWALTHDVDTNYICSAIR